MALFHPTSTLVYQIGHKIQLSTLLYHSEGLVNINGSGPLWHIKIKVSLEISMNTVLFHSTLSLVYQIGRQIQLSTLVYQR